MVVPGRYGGAAVCLLETRLGAMQRGWDLDLMHERVVDQIDSWANYCCSSVPHVSLEIFTLAAEEMAQHLEEFLA